MNKDPIPPKTAVSFTDCKGIQRNGILIAWMRQSAGKERNALIARGVPQPTMMETIPLSRIKVIEVNSDSKQINAEIRLAILLGWTDLKNMGDAVIGTPPEGVYSVRNQALVPRWAHDWNTCASLMIEHEIEPGFDIDHVFAHYMMKAPGTFFGQKLKKAIEPHSDHVSINDAMLVAIVNAVILKLEASAV